MKSWRYIPVIVIPDLIRDPLIRRCVNGSRIKSGMTPRGNPLGCEGERAI